MNLNVTVHGSPAPQGSKRHVGRGIMVESSRRVKPWREAVKEAILRALGEEGPPVGGPVGARVIFTFSRPKSAPKRRRLWPTTRTSGDVDKLLRATFDAITDAGVVWQDDSQVVHVTAEKVYVGDDAAMPVPGATVIVWAIEEAGVASA